LQCIDLQDVFEGCRTANEHQRSADVLNVIIEPEIYVNPFGSESLFLV